TQLTGSHHPVTGRPHPGRPPPPPTRVAHHHPGHPPATTVTRVRVWSQNSDFTTMRAPSRRWRCPAGGTRSPVVHPKPAPWSPAFRGVGTGCTNRAQHLTPTRRRERT